MRRKEIISNIITNYKLTSYLELGVRNPNLLFNHINISLKHSVDMASSAKATFTMTTDEFFISLESGSFGLDKDHKWDVIFIDANHLAGYVKKDLFNSLNHISENGIILLHDVLPTKYEYQIEGDQCQTAWKIIPYLLKYHPELHVCTTKEGNAGIGIVTKSKTPRVTLNNEFNQFYDYYLMDQNRTASQNVIPNSDILTWIDNPYYNFDENTTFITEKQFN